MPADLPTLTQLIDDVSDAMQAAERTRRRTHWWRGWPLGIVLLGLAVPSAAALRAVIIDRRVELPSTRYGDHLHPGAGPAVAIAGGAIQGRRYAFIAQRCQYKGVVTVATSFALGPDPRRDGGGFNSCVASTRRQPLIALSGEWTAGQSWIAALTRPGIASADVFLIRRRAQRVYPHRHPRGLVRTVYFTPTRVHLRTRALDPLAVREGRLPHGYRLFVLFRPRRTDLRRLILRDQRGRVLLTCAARDCDRLAR